MSVRLDVLLTYQSNGLYTALQNLDAPTFWKYIAIFGVLAAVNAALVLISFYRPGADHSLAALAQPANGW